MSIKFGLNSYSGYVALKIAIALWAAVVLFAHGYYWTTLVPGEGQSGDFTVHYGDMRHVTPDSSLDFLLTSVVTVLLMATFWFAFQLVRRLAADELDYSDVIRQLARFATALCSYSLSKVLCIILIASADYYALTGEVELRLLIGLEQVNLLIISFVVFLVGKALRLADDAVQETQTFL